MNLSVSKDIKLIATKFGRLTHIDRSALCDSLVK